MAKQLFFRNTAATFHRGDNTANIVGTATWWNPLALAETRGASASTVTAASIAGTTTGIEFTSGGSALEWISEPLSADFTIAGTITGNMWAAESTMNDNTAINFLVDKIDGATGAITQIAKSARTTELAITTVAVNNFTVTPTSTACKRGDRIRIRPFIDDAAVAMIVGTSTLSINGPTAAAAGDSYIQFTENLTFEPAGDPVASFTQPASGNGLIMGDGVFAFKVSQPFVAQGFTLTSLSYYLAKVGTPTDNAIVEVQSDDGAGNPSGTVIASIATIAGSSVSGTSTLTTHSGLSVALVAGQTYHIVYSRNGTQSTTNDYVLDASIGSVASWILARNFDGTSWSAAAGVLRTTLVYTVSTYYLTNTAESINPGSATEKKALTTRGSGSTNAVTNTAAGPTAGIQTTASAGGTAIEWYTPQLDAFTLGGKSKVNIRALESVAAANASLKAEIAIVAGDGSNARVWGVANVQSDLTLGGEIGTSDAAYVAWVAGSLPLIQNDVSTGSLTSSTWNVSGDGGTEEQAAQSFIPSGTVIRRVKLYLRKNSSPADNLVIEIQSDSGGVPSGTVVGTVATVIGSSLSLTFAQQSYDCNIAVTPAATYWVVLRRTGGSRDVTNNFTAGGSGSNNYANGRLSSRASGVWSVGSAVDLAMDIDILANNVAAGERLRFRIYVDDPAIGPLVTGSTVTVSYNGTTAAAAGDMYVILPQAVTEQAAATGPKPRTAHIRSVAMHRAATR